jgi:hypothetical protein
MFGLMPQLSKALQSLEYQFNLPTQSVVGQDVRRRTAGAGRKYDHVLSKFDCFRSGDHLLLARFSPQAPGHCPNMSANLRQNSLSSRQSVIFGQSSVRRKMQ